MLSTFFLMTRLMRKRPHVLYSPFYPLVRDQFGENPPAMVAISTFYNTMLLINKPGPLTDLFVTKNM